MKREKPIAVDLAAVRWEQPLPSSPPRRERRVRVDIEALAERVADIVIDRLREMLPGGKPVSDEKESSWPEESRSTSMVPTSIAPDGASSLSTAKVDELVNRLRAKAKRAPLPKRPARTSKAAR